MTYQPTRRDTATRQRTRGGPPDPMEARIIMERVLASRGEYVGFVLVSVFLTSLAMVALIVSRSVKQMREAIDAVENTSDYVRGEIARRKAIHNRDMTDLIKDEHDAYYQKVIDSSLAYDELALGGDNGLEKVGEPSHLASLPSNHRYTE